VLKCNIKKDAIEVQPLRLIVAKLNKYNAWVCESGMNTFAR
jgi:hypothetical protein